MPSPVIARIVRAYDSIVVRSYCRIRFVILRQRFLDEIGQYLPEEGRVLDIGCGFGLFSLYFAATHRGLRISGIDLDARRIAMARSAAARLGIESVEYSVGDAVGFTAERSFDAVYVLDVFHHVPEAAVPPLVREIHRILVPGGRLLVKDVERRPAWKRLFTHALDLAMSPTSPVRYWERPELVATLRDAGFRVVSHSMVDVLPYPHVLYVCEKRAPGGVSPPVPV